jgi:hypothetical protein
LAISNQRYWNVTEEGGTFDGAVATLPVINETLDGPIEDLVVVTGTATSTEFTSKGQDSNTGNLISGTIKSIGNIFASLLSIGQKNNDQSAPLATIKSIITKNPSPSLSGIIDDVTATLRVEIDNLSYTATVLANGTWVIASDVIGPLADGYYNVTITATDSLLNTFSTTVANAIFVDATGPVSTANTIATNDPTPSLSGSVGEALVAIEITIGNNTYIATVSNGIWTIANDVVGALDDGYYSIGVKATDSLGNVVSKVYDNAVFVDATAPVVTVGKVLSIKSSPNLKGTLNDLSASLAVTVNGKTYTDISFDGNNWRISSGKIDELPDGVYDIVAQATDTLGNVGVDATVDELIVETDELLVSVDHKVTNDQSPELTGLISSTDATITISLLDVEYDATNNGDGSWTLAQGTITPELPAGIYDVAATAFDPIGLVGNDTSTNELNIDLEAPKIRINDLSTFDNTPRITGVINNLKSLVTLEINGNTYNAINLGDSTWEVADNVIAYLGTGAHLATASATDVAGNTGTNETEIIILPRAVVALPASAQSTSSFQANWSNIPDAAAYLLTVSLERNARKKLVLIDEQVTDTSYVVADLDYGRPFYYRVRVVYASGDTSNFSNIINTNTLTDPNTAIDSLALVSIFQSTQGQLWNDRGSWLQGRLYEWRGISMNGTRVSGIDLSGNYLVGSIPDITDGLAAVTSIDLSDNELVGIGNINSLASLKKLDISDNRLVFGEVSPILGNGVIVDYIPQKTVLDRVRALLNVGDTYTVDRAVNGADAYRWFKDGVLIDKSGASFSISISDFTSEGSYHAEATSTAVLGLNLETAPVDVRVSSLRRDSTALIAIYDAVVTDASQVLDWPSLPIDQWEEIKISNDRVTEIDLSNASLVGDIPDDILDIAGLSDVDFSGNFITYVPELGSLENLSSFDVSQNNLDFESIEPNVDIKGINFSSQGLIGDHRKDTIDRGEDYFPAIVTRGASLTYQWSFNGSAISGATADFYAVRDIDYSSMGDYHVEVKSTLVPDFSLKSNTQQVVAVADIEYFPGFKYADGVPDILDKGQSLLFRITDTGPYDTVGIVPIRNEAVLFESVVLGNYLLLVETEDDYFMSKEFNYTADSISIDTVEFIPSYYISALEWDSANVLMLRDYISDTLDLLRIPPPLTPDDGDGIIGLFVESDFDDDPSGRLDTRRRVKKAGCSLRRRTRSGGGRTDEEEEWLLIAYKETDDNGEVNFGNLPEGSYRLNIQYPGIPMDESTFVQFEISSEEEEDGYELAAIVTTEGIAVEVVEELGFYRKYFKELTVYPNPANDFINISYKRLNAKNVRVDLIDLQGKVVKSQLISKGIHRTIQIEVHDLMPGLYMIYFYDPEADTDKVVTHKVLIRE